jgi:hypothetical protein
MIDRIREKVIGILRDELAYIDTYALYPGTVYGYNRADSVDYVDVRLDDQRFGKGIRRVPVRPGIAGVLQEVDIGARVLVGFTNGRRSEPIATLWERHVTIKLKIESDQEVTVEADAIKLGDSAVLGVARLGDSVQAGPYSGVITSASTKVKAE